MQRGAAGGARDGLRPRGWGEHTDAAVYGKRCLQLQVLLGVLHRLGR